MECINCGQSVENKFCSSCGQRANVKRLSFKEGWLDFWSRIYGFDGMFPRTIRDLTVRPGVASKIFLKGNRVMYYGPVGYFFLMATLLVLLADILNVNLVEFMRGAGRVMNDPKPGSGQDKVMNMIMTGIVDNMKLFFFLLIPIQAFVSRFLFFRRSGYNFIEHAVLPLYVQGHVIWLTIFQLIGYKLSGSQPFFVIAGIVSLIYFGFAYSNWIDYQSKPKVFFKGLGVYITAQIIFLMLFLFAFALLLFFDRELLEQFRPSNNR